MFRSKQKNLLAAEIFKVVYTEAKAGNFRLHGLTWDHVSTQPFDGWEVTSGSWTWGSRYQLYQSPRSLPCQVSFSDSLFNRKQRRMLKKVLEAQEIAQKTEEIEQALQTLQYLQPQAVIRSLADDNVSEKDVKKAVKDLQTWVQ